MEEESLMNKKIIYSLLIVLFSFLFFLTQHSLAWEKDITDLDSNEIKVVKSLCQQVLKMYFNKTNKTIIAWNRTTYNFLPTSDNIGRGDIGTKLDTPISFIGVIATDLSYEAKKIQIELKQMVTSYGTKNDIGQKFRITKVLVLIDLGGAGGTMYSSNDVVTIFPLKVNIGY